jgi:threonine dehydratase
MSARSESEAVTLEDIERARAAIDGLVARTPTLRSEPVDTACGGALALKAENLQGSGSFKLRGASAKLRSSAAACERGVVTGTAGNHGQAVALAARRQGVSCDLFVPIDAPVSKTVPAARLGATLHVCDGTVHECVVEARAFAEQNGVELIHPFDDPEVIAGQGTVGLELLEDLPELRRVVVPVGGGGLISGIAIAVKARRPDVEVIGVQVDACAPWPQSLAEGRPVPVDAGETVADGIAVKSPGTVTLPLIEAWVDRILVVGEEEVGDAMALLLSEGKLVVEGAGAVGVAALLAGQLEPAPEGTAVVLSGGNVDEEILMAVARRSETRHGRGVVLFTTISDRPGSLALLLERVAAAGANVVDVRHLREGVPMGINETGIEMILETRGTEHTESLVSALGDDGYRIHEVIHPEED